MRIMFNSRYIYIPDHSSVFELVSERCCDLEWSLVTVNNRIIRHEIWDEWIIKEGDRVEVLSVTHLGEGI